MTSSRVDVLRGLQILRIGALAFPLVAALVWGFLLYHSAYKATTRHVLVQSQLIAQHLESLIETQRVLHRGVAARLAAEPAEFAGTPEFQRFLAAVVAAQPSLLRMQVLTGAGVVLSDSATPRPDASLLPQDHRDALAAAEPLWIGRQITPQGDVLLISSPITMPGGPGVMLSVLETDVLQRFLLGIATRKGEGEAASISRKDGWLLLRNFDAKPVLLPNTALGRRLPFLNTEGTFETTAVTDGVTRIYGFHWAQDLPVFANFGVPKALVWSEFAKQGLPLLALFALMGLFLWVTAERMRRSLEERLFRQEIHKRAETAERLAEQRIHLMRETNHRVKNNLALVVSLINLQLRGGQGLDADALKARIGAVSHVHDLMHQAKDAVHVDFAAMLADIVRSPAVVPQESGIRVETELEPGILLGPDRITPLAVIAAELLTNAVKHAFPDRPAGVIRLRLARREGSVVLEIADDGVGVAEAVTRRSGSAIIDALVEQIGGHLTRRTAGGLHISLRFTEG